MTLGHNSGEAITADRLRSFVERVERVNAEIADLNADKAEIFKEAKDEGFDTKIIKKVIARREKDPEALATEAALIETYEAAIGTPISNDLAHTRTRARELVPMEGGPREMGLSEIKGLLRSGVRPDQDIRFKDASVYFAIDDRAGLVKVGVSNDVAKRVGQLEHERKCSLRLLGTIPGNRHSEIKAHRLLVDHRVEGEWFTASPEALADIAAILHAGSLVHAHAGDC